MYLKTENVTGSTKRSAVWARWKLLDTPETISKGIRTQLKEQSSYAFAFEGYSRKIILRQTLSSLYRLSLSTLRSASIDKSVYLIQNGADRFSFIFFRGFGTGAMHVLCGLIVGGGLAYTWRRTWLKVAGTCGLLGAAITLHAIYNLLIVHGGAAQYIAYALPVLLVTAGRLSVFRLSRKQ